MLKLWKKDSLPDHEDLFLDYYDQALKWALRLTRGDNEKAEDLVHDVFIHFALNKPNLSKIENLDAYLFTMLRNMMRSQYRRDARKLEATIALEEFESAEIVLRSVNIEDRIKAKEQLRSICKFLCERKETSKGGSALLLRYFLGYFRSEIRLITRGNENSVDFLLSHAAREARLHLNQPKKIGFINKTAQKVTRQKASPRSKDQEEADFLTSTDKFLSEIRNEVFASCKGKCFSKAELNKIYSKSNDEKVSGGALAHIVSCPECIDKVNTILGIPLLKERFPTDTINRNTPNMSGGSGSGGGGGKKPSKGAKDALGKFRQRLNEVLEHEPSELLVAVNGIELGTIEVGARRNKLKLHIQEIEDIRFVEIFSEQGLRLFIHHVDPPPAGAFSEIVEVGLSRNRKFEVSLDFDGLGANLHVVYEHPNYQIASRDSTALHDEVVDETSGDKTDENVFNFGATASKFGGQFSDSTTFQGIKAWFNLQRSFMAGGLALVLIAALIFIQIPQTKVSAAELLARSTTAQTKLTANPEIVLHRTLNLEQRDSAGELVERRRMEVWQSAAKGLRIRRLYDSENRLIVADWRRSDGSRTLYRPGDAPADVKANRSMSLPRDLDDAWQMDLSAKDFLSLVGNAETVSVDEKDDSYILNYPGNVATGLLRASLVLNRKDLRAIGKTIVIEGGETAKEFGISEVRFETPKAADVDEKVFEPEPELIPQVVDEPKEIVEESPEPSPSPELSPDEEPDEPKAKTEVKKEKKITSKAQASTELEIEVISLLDRIDATLGEEVTVTRTTGGSLRIEGVVTSEKRKREVLRALSSVRNNRAVKIRIETPGEAQARLKKVQTKRKQTRVQIQDITPSAKRIPVDKEVRAYLRRLGTPESKLDTEVNRFSVKVMATMGRAKLRAWSLRNHSKRFSGKTLKELKGDARKKWFLIIGGQARSYKKEIGNLRQQIAPLGGSASSSGGSTNINDEAYLLTAMGRLNNLNAALDVAVSRSFTLSGKRSPPIKQRSFWQKLSEAESLATSIERAAQILSNRTN